MRFGKLKLILILMGRTRESTISHDTFLKLGGYPNVLRVMESSL